MDSECEEPLNFLSFLITVFISLDKEYESLWSPDSNSSFLVKSFYGVLFDDNLEVEGRKHY